MSEKTAISAETSAPAAASSTKSKSTSPKKAVALSKKTAAMNTGATTIPRRKPTHPPSSEMVKVAIAALKDKKGSSLQAIKKYIQSFYKADIKKQSIFIKKYLKSAVEQKIIIQVKGTGASGRFKLAFKDEREKMVEKKPADKKPAVNKPAVEKKAVVKTAATAKKPAVKKPAGEKKVAAKKPAAAKKPIGKPKSSSKIKKTGKVPTTKPKAPKPKKSAVPKAKTANK